ncbi:hypothetical protein [Desulfobacter curvatus]|uniref:hypothetical protein n=1 Tax=Desulfobacter curvatus TaxID=2290 RepID=UPI00036709EF|nr:hypothetical protein [Desulfobacter curvatus]
MQRSDKLLYIGISIVLISSYLFFGSAIYSILHKVFSFLPGKDETAGVFLLAYMWGAIGGTSVAFIYFAKEVNGHRSGDNQPFPNIIEPFGYIAFILFSGFNGIVLFSLFHAGFVAAYPANKEETISNFALIVISFAGGVTGEGVIKQCLSFSHKLMRDENEKSPECGGTKEQHIDKKKR